MIPSALACDSVAPAERGTVAIDFAGSRLILHPAGVLLAPATETMIVADLHLEKAASFAARGALLPPHDTLETLRRLARLVAEHIPRRLVMLGDSFHSRIHTIEAGGAAYRLIGDLAARTELIWIAGNHDPNLPLALPGRGAVTLRIGEIALRHLPEDDGRPEIIGHFHPSARLATRAGTQRRRCFLASAERLILPAFGALTGGCDAADPAIASLFPEKRGHAFLMCRDRLERVPLGAIL
jgi:hypothetical protein